MAHPYFDIFYDIRDALVKAGINKLKSNIHTLRLILDITISELIVDEDFKSDYLGATYFRPNKESSDVSDWFLVYTINEINHRILNA